MFPNIEAERGRKGWTKADLARELEVSYSTIKNWLNGTTDIPCSYLIKMSVLFGVSIDYLLGVNPYNDTEAG